MYRTNNRFEVLTPTGWSGFNGIEKTNKDTMVTISLANGTVLKCSMKHRIASINGWQTAETCKLGDIIFTKLGYYEITNIEIEIMKTDFYDLIDVEQNKQYFTNDILSHNCEFIGSSNTLISPHILRRLVHLNQINSDGQAIKIYIPPDKNGKYMVVVDVSRGIGGDYSAFVVFDVGSTPYRVVATYRSNVISPLIFPNIIYEAATTYNQALILVETNDIGAQVADILHHDLEYEGLISATNNGRDGQVIGGGFSASFHFGVRTTKSVKRIGCSNLKTLVEGDQLILNDYQIIYELSRFSQKGTSYEAEEGHDDMVMCCVLFAWLTHQPYFKEITESDVRKSIYDRNIELIEEEILPFGIYDDGNEDDDSDEQPVQYNRSEFVW